MLFRFVFNDDDVDDYDGNEDGLKPFPYVWWSMMMMMMMMMMTMMA